MKKLLSCLLMTVMLLVLLPLRVLNVSAAETNWIGEHLSWKLNGTNLIISGYGEMTNFDSVGYVGDTPWGTNITTVTIQSGVTSIGQCAFQKCSRLTAVVIPDTVVTIGSRAFEGCSNLSAVFIPDSVTTIGVAAFRDCYSLTAVTIPNSVTTIGFNAFSGCISLSTIAFPDSLTSIGYDVLNDTAYYKDKGNWDNNVLYNGKHLVSVAEEQNSGFKEYTIKDGTLVIADNAFYDQYSYKKITIPDSVIAIGESAFSGCSNLAAVTIPDSVTTIGNKAFYKCRDLASVSLGNGVTAIGYSVFYDTAYYKDEENWENGVLYIGKYLISSNLYLSGGCIVKDGTRLIADNAFASNSRLAIITIPDSVISIPAKAFYNCDSLIGVTIGSNVTTIGHEAFNDCDALTTVTIPDSVTTIGNKAFGDCDSLISANIGVTSIGNEAFYQCRKLTSINLSNNVTIIGDKAFYNCDALTTMTIPDSVTTIGGYAFYYCDALTTVTIPDSVTIIHKGTFAHCKKLSTVMIPDSVTTIEKYAFYQCYELSTVTLPDSVTTIGNNAFCECGNLYSIAFSNSVTSIGDDAFTRCSSLSHVWYGGSKTDKESILISKTGNALLRAATWHYNCQITDSHVYDGICDAECNLCDYTRIVPDHTYDMVCDSVCNICGATRFVTHTFDNDCDKACNLCGAKRTVKNHVYDNVCDVDCNVCDHVRAVSSHKYKKVTTKATPTKNGAIKNVCTICGYTASKVTTIYKASKVSLSKTTYTYNGKAQKPSVTVKDSKGKTISSKYYTVTYASGRKNAGTYKVTVTFKGNYSGTKTLTFKINKQTASKVTVNVSKSIFTYNGKAQLPTLTVRNSNGNALKKNTDYTVKLPSGRKNVGKYTVKITFKGNYSGTKSVSYTIKPAAKESMSLLVGDTAKIGAKSHTKITYITSNSKIARVSPSGTVTAKGKGTATITVKSNGITNKVKVTVNGPYVQVSGNHSVLLKKSITLKAATNTSAKIKWSSSNTSVATVSSSGKVTGKKAGSATIYAKITYKGKTYTGKYSVSVKNPYLSLNQSSLTLYAGDTYRLSVNAPSGITVKFKSSNTGVAKVSSSGKITAKNKGSATITAYFTYAGKTYSKTCKLTVKKSNFRTVKNYIINNGTTNSNGHKMIGFYDTRDNNTYYFTIAYNSGRNSLIFTSFSDGSVEQSMSFEYKEGQSYIDVTMLIDLGLSSATITYDLKVNTYSNGSGFTYYIKTVGYLTPDDYEKVIGTYNDLAFNGWELLLMAKTGLDLADLGFKNF